MNKIYKISVLLMVVILASSMAYAGITERVSVSSAGVQTNGDSFASSISADGRFVAFHSYANNLVSGDTDHSQDIFVHDRQTGITECVSVSSAGVQVDNNSGNPSISADGRFVAFTAYADNLVTGDTNGKGDVFVRDRQTGITELVSISSDGVQGNNDCGYIGPSISADGRFVAFYSSASNLVTGDTNGQGDIFVHDRQTGITECVSISSIGVPIGGSDPSISADGRFVAYRGQGIVVYDRQTGISECVSISSDGVYGFGWSSNPSISADGRCIAFHSDATNLVSGDTNGKSDVFVHDRQTGITECVSISSIGMPVGGVSPSLSADGRFVAFDSYASNLVSGDTNAISDVFVYDRQTGITKRVSISSEGIQAMYWDYYGDYSCYPSISSDGRFVAFDSDAYNLVSDDNNGGYVFIDGPGQYYFDYGSDVFVHEMDLQVYTIQGSVKLKDFYAPKSGIVGTATITDGTFTDIYNIVLDGRGKYSFATTLSGICTITVKCSHWLSKTIYGVEIVDVIDIGEVTLTNGDVIGNNEVDFDDINAVRAAYGSIEGEPGWNAMADVNGSGEVDFDDINIVRSNYGEIGE